MRTTPPNRPRRLPALAAAATLALSALAGAGAAHAQLFGDDEARKAIIELRDRFDAQRKQNDARLERMSQDFARLAEETGAPTRRALLDMSNQLETLRQEQARQRGQAEQLARDLSELQRQQKDALVAFDERLRQLEPSKVTLDGQDFRVRPDERTEFDNAMEFVRKASFDAAANAFTAFIKRHTQSGYLPAAHFWLGNAQYANSAFKEAIDAYRRMLQLAPDHFRAPEARLAIANCQIELKDTKSARRTLEDLIKAFPQSEAANTAKDRLARLR
jgi:tol-pal system protein YbgF